MSVNLFNGSNIILNQVEAALSEEKNNGNLSIDYSKIGSFAIAFKAAAGSGFQVSKFDAKQLARNACGKCGIAGKDRDMIIRILTG